MIVRNIQKTIILFVFSALALPLSAKPKYPPKQLVQVVADGYDNQGTAHYLYLLLPNGDHALASCLVLEGKCGLESFAPEKRKSAPCITSKTSTSVEFCFEPEQYWAIRVQNTLYIAGPGEVKTYHIDGAWQSLMPGTPAPRNDPPRWTAICNDDFISYSQERSGTCADHKGVKTWRVPVAPSPHQ